MKSGKLTIQAARRIFAGIRKIEALTGSAKSRRGDRTAPQTVFAVRVTIDGGAAGSSSADCTWTYTAESDAGFEYGTELTPEKCRLPMVPYETTPAGSWGLACFDKDGAFVLLEANECPQVQEC